jgi:hypothetical protein
MSLPPPIINYVDFEVLNEPWNRYKLSDGTLLRSRVVVAQVIKTGQFDPFCKPLYGILAQTFNTIRAPKELRNNPTVPPPTPQQLGSSIVENVTAEPLEEGECIYRCVDGTTLRIKNVFVAIRRTSNHDALGEPIYIIDTQNIVIDDIPKNLWKTQ